MNSMEGGTERYLKYLAVSGDLYVLSVHMLLQRGNIVAVYCNTVTELYPSIFSESKCRQVMHGTIAFVPAWLTS
jgi:hypothetical protein